LLRFVKIEGKKSVSVLYLSVTVSLFMAAVILFFIKKSLKQGSFRGDGVSG